MPTSLDTRAREILIRNDRGGYTVPNGRVYPFQWNWDSAFVALGFAAFDRERAWRELQTLFRSQWEDGFVPHIVFWKDDAGYFPGPAIWQTKHEPLTSGITQPPVAASVVRALWDLDRSTASRAHVEHLFPKLLAWHRWFARVRDPLDNGLALIVHPWESGRDNSPEWDIPGRRIDISKVGPYERRDTSHLDASMRPTRLEYDRYLALVQFGRGLDWDHVRIAQASPFRMIDVGTSMILLRANRDLLALAEMLGHEPEARELRQQIAKSERGMAWLWNDTAGAYCSRDVVDGASSGLVTSMSFLSFYAGLREAGRDGCLLDHLRRLAERVNYLVPSLDPDDAGFDAIRYWRGPVWFVVNYLIGTGLLEAGFVQWGERVRDDTRKLAELSGLYEYYSAKSGHGVGGDDFSWTAAVWLHWAREAAHPSRPNG